MPEMFFKFFNKRKAQAFSVDFLVSVFVITLVLGLWVNSFSSIQKNVFYSPSSPSFLSESYYSQISSGSLPSACVVDAVEKEIVCDCASSSNKIFSQRLVYWNDAWQCRFSY